jgi:Ca2+-binding RTX toxin-like protein
MKVSRLLFVLVVALAIPSSAALASPAFISDATSKGLRIELNYRYPPTQQDVDNLREQITRAQQLMCDVTDGWVNLKEAHITFSDSQRDGADVWLFPQVGRSFSSLAQFGGHVTLQRINAVHDSGVVYSGSTLAHELSHHILGVGDEYEELFRAGSACGIGPNFSSRAGERPIGTLDNSLMQDNSQFCRLPDGRLVSDVDPRWGSNFCFNDHDCTAQTCTGPGCPAAPANQLVCSPNPLLASELSLGGNGDASKNFDLLTGTGGACPGTPRFATDILVSAAFNPGNRVQGAAGSSCGNGKFEMDKGEQCDPSDPAASPPLPLCSSFGLDPAGTQVTCNPATCKFDKSPCRKGHFDGCTTAIGAEKCTPGTTAPCTSFAGKGFTAGDASCAARVCSFNFEFCRPALGSVCGNGIVDPGEECDIKNENGKDENAARDRTKVCSDWFTGAGGNPLCAANCTWNKDSCVNGACAATAGHPEACTNFFGVPPGVACGSGFPGGAPKCAGTPVGNLCTVDLSACSTGTTPFDFSTFDQAEATSTGGSSILDVVDPRGQVDSSGGERGGSLHYLQLFAKHFATNVWDVYALGHGEEYVGGTLDKPVLAKRFRVQFDPATHKVVKVDGTAGTTGTLVLGGPKTMVDGQLSGTGAFKGQTEAAQFSVAMHFDDVVEDLWNNFNGVNGDTTFFSTTKVTAGTDAHEQQVGLCTDTTWCKAAWNQTTGRFEGTDHRIMQSQDWFAQWTKGVTDRHPDTVLPTFPVGDWDLMRVAVEDQYHGNIAVTVPPGRPDPSFPGNRNCVGPVTITVDAPSAADAITLVIDRSGSMVTPVDAAKTFGQGTGETRLSFAQAAARGFVDLLMLRPPGNRPLLGLVSFSDNPQTNAPLVKLTTGTAGAGEMTVTDFKSRIAALQSGGNTAIGRGLAEAERQLDPAAVNGKAVILLSDGENNRPTDPKDPDFDPLKVRDRLQNKPAPKKPINIFTVPAGSAADGRLLREMATNGQTLAAPGGDELPVVYAEALATLRGDSVVVPRTPLALAETRGCAGEGSSPGIAAQSCPAHFAPVDDPVAAAFNTVPGCTLVCKRIEDDAGQPLPAALTALPVSSTLTLRVEQGARALNLMLSTRNPKGSFWDPRFRLKDPTGAVVLDDGASAVINDVFYRILDVRSPTPGDWTVEVASLFSGGPQFLYLLAQAEDPLAGCIARVNGPVVSDSKGTVVFAQAHYDRPLTEGVSFSGRLIRPDRSEQPLDFSGRTATGEAFAIVPPTALIGRGIYEVRVACDVAADARYARSEQDKPGIDDQPGPTGVPAFRREVPGAFYVLSANAPPLPPGGDANNNGIPDPQEPPGDIDGDGVPNPSDDDPKGDDDPRPPGGDPSCTGTGCPLASAGPDVLVQCEANQHTTVTLDGRGSKDPANLPLTFAWTAAPVLLQNPNQSVASGSFPIGTITASLTVSNGSKSSTDTASITVLDLAGPALTVPASKTVSACSSATTGSASAVDGCGGAVTIVNDAPPKFPVGATVVNWFAIDQFGNISTKQQTITVTVATAPTITVPADRSATTCSVPAIGTATAADACGVALPVSSDAPSKFPVGVTQVTWTATDNAGRVVSKVQKVTITLGSPPAPSLTVPADVTVTTCQVPPLGRATATDACGATVTVTNNAPTRFGVGVTTVTWTAKDNRGGTTTKTQKVTVNLDAPVPPPFLQAPPDVTTTSCTSTAASIGTPVAFDACQAPVKVTSNAPSKFPLGTTTVTWTAVDQLGHTTTRTQVVTAELGDDKNCCPASTHIIVGTAGADVISGTSGSDCILGLGGDDTLVGNAGNDFISGGAGRDTINAGDGDDTVYGGDGDDTIDSGNGNDKTFGGLGNDTINGGLGSDLLDGGDGTDTCTVAPGGTDTVRACEVLH